jgi:hypothetical protein
VEELEVISEVTESKGDGVVVQVKRPVVHPVCALHAQHIKEGAGWQQRMKDSSRRLTVEAKKRLARDQGRLW